MAYQAGMYAAGFQSNYVNGVSLLIELPLPNAEDFYQDVYALSWPQVIGFGGVCIGILITGMIVSALRG